MLANSYACGHSHKYGFLTLHSQMQCKEFTILFNDNFYLDSSDLFNKPCMYITCTQLVKHPYVQLPQKRPRVQLQLCLTQWSRNVSRMKFHCTVMIMCYCAKHNQHAQHANAKGVWGHAPKQNLKNRCSEIESEGITESIYLATYVQF